MDLLVAQEYFLWVHIFQEFKLRFLLKLLDVDVAGPHEAGEDPDNSSEVTHVPSLVHDILLVDVGEEDVHHHG